MTKCDFCVYSSPHEKCFWTFSSDRREDCQKAIERMTEALKGIVTVKVEGNNNV